jgi:hypothetical protein
MFIRASILALPVVIPCGTVLMRVRRFSWANGLFGQMLLDVRERKPEVLGLSYQY